MTNQQVIDKILGYHPQLGTDYSGCDNWKAGNPMDHCRGIVTALSPTINVIKKAIAIGANLIIVHEPTFYTSLDEPGWFEDFSNEVYEKKNKLIQDNGITIWRDHDHMHAHNPDAIFTGLLKCLDFEKYVSEVRNNYIFSHYILHFPELSLAELCNHIINSVGINGIKYVGDPDAKIGTLAIVGHLFPSQISGKRQDGKDREYSVDLIELLETEVDAIMPGETIDWTVLSYIRDANQLGRKKAMITMGHFNWEEAGMKYAQEWISALIGNAVPVTYVPSEDMYNYIIK